MKSSLGKPTVAEQDRIDAMRHLGCLACAHIGIPNQIELELNHLLSGNRRLGHWFTIFLCGGHHQSRWTVEQTLNLPHKYLVSIAQGRKAFARVFGTERSLWERGQIVLGLETTWMPSKIVERRVA